MKHGFAALGGGAKAINRWTSFVLGLGNTIAGGFIAGGDIWEKR